jgi:hypothetical protein
LKEIRISAVVLFRVLRCPTVDVGRRYRPRASFALVRFAARVRCVSLRGSSGPLAYPSGNRPGRGGDATSTPWCVAHPVHRRRRSLQRWSSTVVTGRPGYRPVGQARPGDSREVSRVGASLQRSPVAPCRPGVAVPGPSRCGVCGAAGTRPVEALAPVRFFDASRLPGISFVRGTPPLRVIRRRIRSRRCTGPAGCSRDLGGPGLAARRRSWGSPVPFAALLLACGRRRVSRVTGPTCRLVRSVAASVFARGRATSRRGRSRIGRAASGRSSRGQAVPCGPPAPL